MKTNRTISLTIALALLTLQSAFAAPLTTMVLPDVSVSPLITIEADCYALGQDKAAELGGTLAKADSATDDGAPVCKIVVVVPGKDGERPKRVALTVPQ